MKLNWEETWWGNCVNTYGEETKQLTYAHRMGLQIVAAEGHWPVYNLGGKKVLDLGGGPVSILLKCRNVKGVVVDPGYYPEWTRARYTEAGITVYREPAEGFSHRYKFDEVWIYNVLQHVASPEDVIKTARSHAPLLRIFEWLDIPPHIGHPHELKAIKLNEWLGCDGTVEYINENGCGPAFCYYGLIPLL